MARTIKIGIETTLSDKGIKDTIKGLGLVEKASVQAAKSQAALASAQARIDSANAKSAQSAARLATAQSQASIASERLAQASARTASDLLKLESQQSRTALSALRLQQAVEKAAKPPSGGLSTFFEKVKGDATSAITGMVAFGAAVEGVRAIGQAFVDAFNWKAALDANTASINVQLGAVRNTGQVWQEAAAFADEYKLTQEQTTAAVGASINVLKTSSASVGDTLEALSRLNLANTTESIEGAAFAVAELASGDINSIVERFRVSKDEAYAMRDAIAAGADPVAVLSDYLDRAGLSAEALKTQTQGIVGAQKDVAKAAEDVTKAMAAWAEGPGMAILELQADGLRLLAQGMGEVQLGYDLMVNGSDRFNTSASSTVGALVQLATGNAMTGDSAQKAASDFLTWIGATDQATAATDANTAADQANTDGKLAAGAGTDTLIDKTLKEADAKKKAADDAALLAQFNRDLAALAGAVAAGHITAGAAAAQLAAQYGGATVAAERLLNVQAQLAGGGPQKRLASPAGATRTLARPDLNAPGRKGMSDDEIFDTVARTTAANAREAEAAAAALSRQIMTTGTAAQRTAELQRQYNAAVAQFGPHSSQAIEAETALRSEHQKSIASAGRAGGAASKRATAEQEAGNKIIEIAQQTANKLAEIEEKAAERRAEAQRKLASDILTSSAEMVVQQQANDLELVGASEDRIAKLAAREEAEAKARIAQAEAVAEAQRISAEGDAEMAGEVLAARQEAISQQQSLDEDYAKRRAELAGDPALLEALKTQYDEATQAIADQTAIAISLAQSQADQRKAAAEAEKQAVLESAAAQVAAMGKTGEAAGAAQGRVAALASAIANLPDKTVTIRINEQRAGGSATSSVSAAGGGNFLATSETKFRVGESGPEMVSVTPLTSGGRTTVSGGGVISMGGGGQAIVDDAAAKARDMLGGGTSPLPTVAKASGKSGGGGGGGSAGSGASSDALKEVNDAIELLQKMAELRSELARVGPPINMEVVNKLADEALKAAAALGTRMVKVSEEDNKTFGLMADSISDAIGVLSDIASLRDDLANIGPPINMAVVDTLADEALKAAATLGVRMVHVTEADNKAFGLMADSASDALGVLEDAASLRNAMVDVGPPLDEKTLERLAMDAQQVLRVIKQSLIPLSEEQAEVIGRYVDAAGASIGLLADASQLSAKNFADYQPPSDADLQRFVGDTQRVVQAVDAAAAVFEKEGLESAKVWAETSSAISSAVQEGLVTFDKLRFSDIGVDQAQLQKFVAGSTMVLDAVDGLAARAATVDMGGLSNLSTIAATVGDSTAMLSALAAAPSFGGGGNSSTSISFGPGSIVITIPGGAPTDANALANQLLPILSQKLNAQRGSYK